MRHYFTLAMALCLLLLLPGTPRAQAAAATSDLAAATCNQANTPNLNPGGAPLNGEITAARSAECYLVIINAGVLNITINYGGSRLKPTLALYDSSGTKLKPQRQQNGQGRITASYSFAQPNAYLVEVSREGGKNGTSTGKYTIAATLVEPPKPCSEATVARSFSQNQLNQKVSDASSIDGQNPRRCYSLVIEKSGTLTVLIDRTSGNLEPEVRLSSGGKALKATSRTSARDGKLRTITFAIPQPNTYLLEVTRQGGDQGSTKGNFTMTLSFR